MDIGVEHGTGGVTVLRPSGRLNMTTAMDLRQSIVALVTGGDLFVVVDLSEVDFIDSSGLGGLVSGLKTAREAGGDLRLASPTEQVRLVLQLTNLERMLISYDDADLALRSFSS